MLVEIFHLVKVVKCISWSLNLLLKLAAVHALSASYHRLQACSSLRLALLDLAELRVLFFDDPVILALKERKATAFNGGCDHIVWMDNISMWMLSWPCASPSAPPCLRSCAGTWAPSRPCFWRPLLPSAWVCPPAVANSFTLNVLELSEVRPVCFRGCGWPLWWALRRLQTWTGDCWIVWHGPPRWVFWGFELPLGGCRSKQTSFRVFSWLVPVNVLFFFFPINNCYNTSISWRLDFDVCFVSCFFSALFWKYDVTKLLGQFSEDPESLSIVLTSFWYSAWTLIFISNFFLRKHN